MQTTHGVLKYWFLVLNLFFSQPSSITFNLHFLIKGSKWEHTVYMYNVFRPVDGHLQHFTVEMLKYDTCGFGP